MQDDIKTIDGWNKSGKDNWLSYAKPNDKVSEDIIDYFMNIVAPLNFSADFFQLGSPNDCILAEDGKMKSTYVTFFKKNGIWKFCGTCFAKEKINRSSDAVLGGVRYE